MGRNPAHRTTDEAFDFKGNLLRGTRQLVERLQEHRPDWSQNPALEAETFTSSTRYDALNRPIQLVAPHSDRPGAKLNVIRPGYNEANLLERVDVWLEQTNEPAALLESTPQLSTPSATSTTTRKASAPASTTGTASRTHYEYDPFTFRLSRLLTDRGPSIYE